jgi:hypothetical protein
MVYPAAHTSSGLDALTARSRSAKSGSGVGSVARIQCSPSQFSATGRAPRSSSPTAHASVGLIRVIAARPPSLLHPGWVDVQDWPSHRHARPSPPTGPPTPTASTSPGDCSATPLRTWYARLPSGSAGGRSQPAAVDSVVGGRSLAERFEAAVVAAGVSPTTTADSRPQRTLVFVFMRVTGPECSQIGGRGCRATE